MTTTETPRDVKTPEFVTDLHGCYDNFLSGRRYYISGGQVYEFIDARLLRFLGGKRFGFYPDFPTELLSQLTYK